MNTMQNYLIAGLMSAVFLLECVLCSAAGETNGTFSGQVLDVDRVPVSGASVFVYDCSNVRRPADFLAPAGTTGEFKVTLPAGHYWAVARVRQGDEQYGPLLPGDRHSGAPVEIDITAGGKIREDFIVADLTETSQLTSKRDASFLRIDGKLVNGEGQPVPDAYAFARLQQADGNGIPEYVSAWTDSSGEYSLFLPPGTYWLGVAREFPPDPESLPRQNVTIDKPDKSINIVLE